MDELFNKAFALIDTALLEWDNVKNGDYGNDMVEAGMAIMRKHGIKLP